MDDVALGAEEVATKEFPVGFRGYGQHEVRAFLAQVAAELAAARERERLQRERLVAAEERASSRSLSEEEVEAVLGREAGRVLQAAREAATDIRSRAEEQVARLVKEASGEGSRAQQEAESLLARRTEEAEKAAVEIVTEAEAKAAEELDEAKAEGRRMVSEAQAVRERILKDLARRRRVAHQQLEQLRAGRERLLEAYRLVRSTLDEATRELTVAEVEARAAAERAALRAGSLPETSVEELEAELAGARDIGLASVPADRFVGVGHGQAHNGSAVIDSPPPPEPEIDAEVVPLDEVEPEVEAGIEADLGPEPEPDLPEVEAGIEADLGPEPEPDLPDFAVEPEPEPEVVEVAVEPEPEPEVAAEAEPEPEPEAEPVVETYAETPVDVSTGPGDDAHTPPPASPKGVDALFARLRAERATPFSGEDADPTDAETVVAGDLVANGTVPATAVSPVVVAVDDEDVLQARDAEVSDVERSLAKALKRALADEQNEVLDILRRSGGGLPLTELLPAASDHTARYLAVAGPELRTAARRGTAIAGEPPAIEDLAVSLAATVSEDLRARLQRALEEADGEEGPLLDGISAAYREWKTSRVEPLARHHVAAAHTRGRFTASEGPLRWVVDGEEGPCPDCDDNALAGAIAKGQEFPTGQPYPPAHLGCRCTVVGEPG